MVTIKSIVYKYIDGVTTKKGGGVLAKKSANFGPYALCFLAFSFGICLIYSVIYNLIDKAKCYNLGFVSDIVAYLT